MLHKVQQEHQRWQKKNFTNVTADEMFLGMVEEIGELSHALLKKRQGVRVNENHEENAKDAVGDILIYMIGFCTQMGWDIETLLETAWDEVSQRDWINFPVNGRDK